jgi:pyruvate/2-oxoglutarate dehydrogenase complex dihydrolipoamide dehydrogenase (E3) component/uncharacterized membrane protein YdjX (TVP38/TMEM64 family)
MQKNFDVVVIGAGSGGLTSAVGFSKLGKKVLLVEREHMGGECTNTGCIPSKALLHYAAEYYHAVRVAGTTSKSEDYRTSAFTYVQNKVAEILAEETPAHFENLGITVVLGEAIFTSKKSLTVGTESYTFKKAIIATGSSPRPLAITGLETTKVLTNQNLFNLETVPERTLIIGGGPIGMEMGQALAMLGSKVTIIENGPRFARLEDEAIGKIITKEFTDLGITIITNASVTAVVDNVAEVEEKTADGKVISQFITFDKVLVAIGRVPNLPQGLATAGITSTEFGITVDSNYRTSNHHVYALGDVASRLKFTHVADDAARQVVTHVASFGLLSVKEKAVPKVTYTVPEIGQVGLSEAEAATEYGAEKIVRIEVPFSNNDRARTDDATIGIAIIIAKRLSGRILGAHIIGPRAGELIGTLTLAMENDISFYRLRSTIFAYPTYSLILKKAGDYFLAKQFATIKQDVVFILKLLLPKLLVLLIWSAILLYLYTYKVQSGLSFTELSVALLSFIKENPLAPLLYIILYAVRPLTFFPGTALTILSGVFFGLWGILYTVIGANLSAALAYLVGRYFSRSKAKTASIFSAWQTILQNNPFLTILTMRLTFMPFDVVNYGAGLLRVPFLPYLNATFVGTLLGIATFVTIGASLSVEEFIKNGVSADAIDRQFIILSAIIFFFSIGIAKLAKYHDRKLR